MADNTINAIAKDGTSYSIPNTPESIADATSKGYQVNNVDISPLQEQAAYPATAPQFQQAKTVKQAPGLSDEDLTPDNQARVVDKSGNVFNIPSTPESVLDAKNKDYQLLSDYNRGVAQQQENQVKLDKYTEIFKNKYGEGTAFQTALSAATPATNLPLRPEAFQSFRQNPQEQVGLTEDEKKFQGLGIPHEFHSILNQENIPNKDLRVAAQALESLRSQHPIAGVVGEVINPKNLPLAALGGVAEEGALAALPGLADKGILKTLARTGVRSLVDTAVFNAPDEIRNAIINQQGPQQTAENLVKDTLFNTGFHALGGTVALGGKVAKGIIQGEGISDALAAGKLAISPTSGQIDKAQAQVLRDLGYDDTTINNNPNKANTLKLINDHLGFDNLEGKNSSQVGHMIQDMGKESGKKIGEITKQLDELSTPSSKVELPEAQNVKISENTLQENFIKDYLNKRYQEQLLKNTTNAPFNEWASTDDSQGNLARYKQEALQQYKDIKSNKLSQTDFVDQHIAPTFNHEFSPNYTAETNPDEFNNWKLNEADGKMETATAKDIYNNVQNVPIDKVGTNDNYQNRANGQNILSKISELGDSAVGTIHEPILHNAEKKVRSLMDENGRIDPTSIKELTGYFSDLIPKGDVTNAVTGMYKQLSNFVKKERDVSEAAISGAANRADLAEQLKDAKEKFQIFKDANEGKDMINRPVATAAIRRPIGFSVKSFAAMLGVGAIRSALTPYWSEIAAPSLNRAVLKNLTNESAVSHLVINGAIKQQQFLKQLPSLLLVSGNAKENQKFDAFKTLLGDKANGLSKEQQWKTSYNILNDPGLIQRQQEIASSICHPELSQSVATQIAKMHQILKDAIPPVPAPEPFQENKPVPPTAEALHNFNEVVRLVNDPDELVKEYQAGTITPKQVHLVT